MELLNPRLLYDWNKNISHKGHGSWNIFQDNVFQKAGHECARYKSFIYIYIYSGLIICCFITETLDG